MCSIDAAHASLTDRLERLAGGMLNGVAFALGEPRKTAIMIHNAGQWTRRDHRLKQSIVSDLRAVIAAGLLRPKAETSGVRYWPGLCQALMLSLVEREVSRPEAAARLPEMLVLGLTGLGLPEDRARRTADRVSAQLWAQTVAGE